MTFGVADFAGLGLHRLIDDVVGIDASCRSGGRPSARAPSACLGLGRGRGPKSWLTSHFGYHFCGSPEERVAAQRKSVRRGVIGDRVQLAEVELVGPGRVHCHLSSFSGHEQRAFALEDRGIGGIGEAAAIGAGRPQATAEPKRRPLPRAQVRSANAGAAERVCKCRPQAAATPQRQLERWLFV